MPTGAHVVFACDQSGAKGYADKSEAWPGEVGVFAGLLIPQAELATAAESAFQAIVDRYKPAFGKLHIADLEAAQQQALRDDVFSTIRKLRIPCCWYAIHVEGLHDHHLMLDKLHKDAKRNAAALSSESPSIKPSGTHDEPLSMHIELFKGLYAHLIALLSERGCVDTVTEIRTDQIDSPIVKDFKKVASGLLSGHHTKTKVTGYDIVEKKTVSGFIEIRIDLPAEYQFSSVVRSLAINAISGDDGYVLAADVLANSLNYLFKKRGAAELYQPLNRPSAVKAHPLADRLDSFFNWGDGDLMGDRIYSHPAGRPGNLN